MITANNRAANASKGVRLESSRDTSNIEYSCDTQLSLNFTVSLAKGKSGKNPNSLTKEERKYRTITVTKNRNGEALLAANFVFDGEIMTFVPAATHSEADESDDCVQE